MAKKKKPAPKRGGKNAPVPQGGKRKEKAVPAKAKARKAPAKLTTPPTVAKPLTERQIDQRNADQMRADSYAASMAATPRRTIEDLRVAQRDAEARHGLEDRVKFEAMARALPAPPPTTKRSKFWRQYQDETGQFIGWRKALTKTKDQVISRLRLRKSPR